MIRALTCKIVILKYINKSELFDEFNVILMQKVIENDPEMLGIMSAEWLNEYNQMVTDLVEEGKRLGYIDEEISVEAILYYFEILRRGGLASADLLANLKVDEKLACDLNRLFFFGLLGKKQ